MRTDRVKLTAEDTANIRTVREVNGTSLQEARSQYTHELVWARLRAIKHRAKDRALQDLIDLLEEVL
jgi:hypothetical protein